MTDFPGGCQQPHASGRGRLGLLAVLLVFVSVAAAQIPEGYVVPNFKDVELVAGWDWDTRNRTLFADRGSRFSTSISSTVPGADVEYYIANAQLCITCPSGTGSPS